MPHFDKAERERRDGGGIKPKPLLKTHVNAEMIKELLGIHGSGWCISGEKSLVRTSAGASSLLPCSEPAGCPGTFSEGVGLAAERPGREGLMMEA